MKKFSKIIGSFLLLFLFVSTLRAQETIPSHQFRFYAMPSLFSNLKVSNEGYINSGFSSKISYGGELGFGYYQNLVRGFGANIGVGYGLQSFNYHYSFNNPSNMSMNGTKTEWRHLITVPLSFNYYVPLKSQKWLWNFELGMKMNWSLSNHSKPTAISLFKDIPPFQLNNFDLVVSYQPNPLTFSYFFKTGFSKITNKKNTINLNFVFNYLPQSFIRGTYRIHTFDGDESGIFSYKRNFIGIEFIYGLNLSKKK